MGISGADLVRLEIAIALDELHAVVVPDEVMGGWETVEDVVRSVLVQARGRPWQPPLTDAEALLMVQQLIARGWGLPPTGVRPEMELLRFEEHGRFRK